MGQINPLCHTIGTFPKLPTAGTCGTPYVGNFGMVGAEVPTESMFINESTHDTAPALP